LKPSGAALQVEMERCEDGVLKRMPTISGGLKVGMMVAARNEGATVSGAGRVALREDSMRDQQDEWVHETGVAATHVWHRVRRRTCR
jgi:hypothetical protein